MNGIIPIIMYHYVRPRTDPPYISLSAEGFEQQVKYLLERGPIISFRDLALGKTGSILTFDDGLKDHYLNAYPILKKWNVTGAFYPSGESTVHKTLLPVHLNHYLLAMLGSEKYAEHFNALVPEENAIPTDRKLNEKYAYDDILTANIKHVILMMPEREKIPILTTIARENGIDLAAFHDMLYLDREEIRELVEGGMEIGSHGFSHQSLSTMGRAEQEEEIRKTQRILSSITGEKTVLFSYPYGGYDAHTLDLLGKYGFTHAVTTDFGLSDRTTPLLRLKRIDTNKVETMIP
ncbi:MAG: polysaccharide deacetylase family protein [Methanomicrobiales archaeon]|nr:polysaccharide deacetylase family protein [Methanomicrobiales archaeon]